MVPEFESTFNGLDPKCLVYHRHLATSQALGIRKNRRHVHFGLSGSSLSDAPFYMMSALRFNVCAQIFALDSAEKNPERKRGALPSTLSV